MSKQCQGGCNRFWDEYYILEDSSVFCYDCWKRAMDGLRESQMERHRMVQEGQRRYYEVSSQRKNLEAEISIKKSDSEYCHYNDSEIRILRQRVWDLKEEEKRCRYPMIPSFSNSAFLVNATYYTKAEATALENKEREEQQEQEQKTIAKAQGLLRKAKQQTQNRNLSNVQSEIAKIERLIQKQTYADSLNAIDILEKQCDWQLNAKDTFSASLSNFDNSKEEFEQKRLESIKDASSLLERTKQSITKDSIGQTTIKIHIIEKLIEQETLVDSTEAIGLLTKDYTWKTNSGKTFVATLPNFDKQLEQCEETEKAEKENIRLTKLKNERQQKKEEAERRRQKEAQKILSLLL